MIDKKLSRAEFNVDFWAQMFVVKHFINLEKGQFLIKLDVRLQKYSIIMQFMFLV